MAVVDKIRGVSMPTARALSIHGRCLYIATALLNFGHNEGPFQSFLS